MKQAPPKRRQTCQTSRDHIPEVGIPYSHGTENVSHITWNLVDTFICKPPVSVSFYPYAFIIAGAATYVDGHDLPFMHSYLLNCYSK
jgi:hypothetical protein